jgi:hypothetical protein
VQEADPTSEAPVDPTVEATAPTESTPDDSAKPTLPADLPKNEGSDDNDTVTAAGAAGSDAAVVGGDGTGGGGTDATANVVDFGDRAEIDDDAAIASVTQLPATGEQVGEPMRIPALPFAALSLLFAAIGILASRKRPA